MPVLSDYYNHIEIKHREEIMQDMMALETGKRYPDEVFLAKLKELGMDGCTFNPFLDDKNPAMFYIHLTDITDEEVAMFNNGRMMSALDVDGGAMVMTFVIDRVTYECPINMHYHQGTEVIPEAEENMRLAATLVAIEASTGEIKALRAFTLHPKATAELIVRAKMQLTHLDSAAVDKANDQLIINRVKHGLADGVVAWDVGV